MQRLTALLTIIITTTLAAATAPADAGGYLFATFRDERGPTGEQVYFALSRDGVRWDALNNGEPVLVSTLGEKGARDPYLLRSADGKKFFLIATDLSINRNPDWKRAVRGGSRSLLIWESDDLAHWSEPRLVEVAPPDAGCAWAPEAVYDSESKRYLVYWASTTGRDNFEKHRIWAAWTTDFRTFGDPFIYIEKPTTIIDTDIVRGDDGKWYRFTKDEKFKAITMETSDAITGEWSDVPGFSLAQLRGYEGPACYQLAPARDGKPAKWCLLLDAYATRGGYKPFVTGDLVGGNFTPGAEFVFPFRFRHGSVLPVSAEEYARIGAAFSAPAAFAVRVSIADEGALGDGATINTAAIQSAIDRLSAKGGGTLVIPPGVFVSGALFLKPGVNLHLENGAVLRATTDMTHFPSWPTRIEGQIREFTPALINADRCDGLRITGGGALDGDGREIWDEFWARRKAAADPRNFPNLGIPRARLALITNSRDVLIDGPAFKDSQFWNLHLYLCQNVTVRNTRFTVPDDYKQAPSTDGIDVDSSQDILIENCSFSVTDDCIALKGTKGPFALDDKLSPPVERIRVRGCVFKRGPGVTLGSEATVVRDVVVENCRALGPAAVLNFKLRPDTPQTYENIHYRNIILDADSGSLVSIRPWKQYFDLKGQPPPRSVVRNITLTNIKGRYGNFGIIEGNPGQTVMEDISLADIGITVRNDRIRAHGVNNLRFENVIINGKPTEAPDTVNINTQ